MAGGGFKLFNTCGILYTYSVFIKYNNSCGKPLAVQLSGPYKENRTACQPIRLQVIESDLPDTKQIKIACPQNWYWSRDPQKSKSS